MYQNQMINTVLDWERRLEIEDERRKNHRYEPYTNNLAPIQPYRKEHESIFARIFRFGRDRQPDRNYAQEPCREMVPC